MKSKAFIQVNTQASESFGIINPQLFMKNPDIEPWNMWLAYWRGQSWTAHLSISLIHVWSPSCLPVWDVICRWCIFDFVESPATGHLWHKSTMFEAPQGGDSAWFFEPRAHDEPCNQKVVNMFVCRFCECDNVAFEQFHSSPWMQQSANFGGTGNVLTRLFESLCPTGSTERELVTPSWYLEASMTSW